MSKRSKSNCHARSKIPVQCGEAKFAAGWGEDSDGDGLPDIYEVLVTHTSPDNADTGDTGTLDGDKDMSGDGWNNSEKFRCRADPTPEGAAPGNG